MNTFLPHDSGLDIGALGGSLSDTTNSYKFLWLLGFLECLPDDAEKCGAVIPQKSVFREMIKAADHCIRRHRLKFGTFDKMDAHLQKLARAAQSVGTVSFLDGNDEAREIAAAFDKVCRDLSRFVPQQWLVPFVKRGGESMPARSDAVAAKVRELAAKFSRDDNPPPYCFAADRRGADIVVNPEWHRYFLRNREIVRGWALFKWIQFLQARNPNTPGIVAKIAHPERRMQLGKEREWWRAMIKNIGGVQCIYSGAAISANDDFALDHYVPWSFVGHNRLWNLIPATPAANGGKSDNLPDEEKYFSRFIHLQHGALSAYCGGRERKTGWRDMADSYTADLRVNLNPPPSMRELSDAYRTVIPPLMTLAESQGFSPNWDYDNRGAKTISPQRDIF